MGLVGERLAAPRRATAAYRRDVEGLQPGRAGQPRRLLRASSARAPHSRFRLASRHVGGAAAVERLYVAYGSALHAEQGDLRDAATQARCLTQAGLPLTLFD